MSHPAIQRLVELQRRRLIATVLGMAGLMAVPLAVIVVRLGAPGWAILSAAGLLVATCGAWLESRWSTLTARSLCDHLDRRVPAVEDSANLLLEDPEALPVLQRLQRDRVASALDAALQGDALGGIIVWPRGDMIRFALVAISVMLIATLLPSDGVVVPGAGQDENAGLARLTGVEVRVEPPAYTARAVRTELGFDLDVEEGSQLAWTLSFDRAVADVRLSLDDGTTAPAIAVDSRRYRIQRVAHNDRIYRLEWRDGGGRQHGDYHRIRLIRDAPPSLVVRSPERSPTVLGPSGAPTVDFLLEAEDDYAIAEAHILATVAKGEGEGVKFRDVTLPFDQRVQQKNEVRLGRRWDLATLGMSPGDELYFRAVVSDNRQPSPNRARTPMLMIRWESDEQPVGLAIEGIAVDLLPEYFRSQRQIIIDTEKLLADAATISRAEGTDRSRSLAFEQKALRLRYGQYLGEEYSTEIGYSSQQLDARASDSEGEHDQESYAEHLEHAHGSAEGGGSGDDHNEAEHGPVSSRIASLPDFMASFVHVHDNAEQATLFDEKTRATLKAALAAMWKAELELHLSQPQRALPHEYTALNLLKQVQQANRIYVRRVGFEPPPLDEGKRLSGDLDEAFGSARSDPRPDDDDDPDQHWFGQLMAEAPVTELGPALSYYRERLSDDQEAIEVRFAITRLLGGEHDCVDCLAAARAYVWERQARPIAAPRPRLQTARPSASAYLRRIGEMADD